MTVTTTDPKVGLDLELSDVDFSIFIEDPDSLLPRANNLTLGLDDPRIFKAMLLTGALVEGSAKLVEPGRLVRMHKIWRENGEKKYWLASYMVSGAKVEISITDPTDGDRISLTEYMRRIFNRNLGESVPDYTETRFGEWIAAKLGIRLDQPQNWFGMQMGAHEPAIDAALELLKSHGAKDVRGADWGGITEAYAIPRDLVAKGAGELITSFEVGAMDRSQTKSGQGFVDLVHAQMESFSGVLDALGGIAKQRRALKQRIEANDQSLTEDKIRELNAALDSAETNARAYRSTWAGSTPHYRWNETRTELILTDRMDPVSIPGGRLGTTDGAIDLWKPRKSEQTNTPTGDAEGAVEESGFDLSHLGEGLAAPKPPESIKVVPTGDLPDPPKDDQPDLSEFGDLTEEQIKSLDQEWTDEEHEYLMSLSEPF